MKKIFTIHHISRNNVSPEHGVISWQVSDENGRDRKINGVTTLDKSGAIVAVRAIFKREEPLAEALLLYNEGETFTIDFTPFNQAQQYAARDVYNGMQRHGQYAQIGGNVKRALALIVLGGIMWLAWELFTSVNGLNLQPITPKSHELP